MRGLSARAILMAAAMLAVLVLPFPGHAAGPWPLDQATPLDLPYVPGEVLVKFRPAVTTRQADGMITSFGFTAAGPIGHARSGVTRVRLNAGMSVEQAVATLSALPEVDRVQPNYIYRALATPNDPMYPQQWGFRNQGQAVAGGTYGNNPGTTGADMELEQVWNVRTDCRDVVVAVIDTGIHHGHVDLAPNMWINAAEQAGAPGVDDDSNGFTDDIYGYDFVDNDGDPVPADGSDHGTHVAGTIAAVGNNGSNGTGVCWRARIMAVRALGALGGTSATLIASIDYAVANGARVINLSLGSSTTDPLVTQAIANARAQDVVVVAAAGNDGTNNDQTPVSPCTVGEDNILCVAALDQAFLRASFSNYGPTTVDVAAPGTNVYSTAASRRNPVVLDNGWTTNSGWAQVADCPGAGNEPALTNPANGCNGGAAYANGADDRIYRVFDMDQGGSVLGGALVAELWWQLASGGNSNDTDAWFYGLDTGAGSDPFDGNGDVTFNPILGNSGGAFVPVLFPLALCVGVSSCGVGLQLRTDGSGTAGGLLVRNMTWLTVEANSDPAAVFNGTSMAAPHVAGLAALLRAHNPSYTYRHVIEAIENSGEPVAGLSGLIKTGRAVNGWNALRYITRPRITGASVTLN